MNKPKLTIICGPTASGKSRLAMHMAKCHDGLLINADSMQVYSEIPIITASPRSSDKSQIGHYLYNYISVADSFSVAKYLTDVTKALEEISSLNKRPIIVGGTGLYISSLINGLCEIPDIDDEVRQRAREEFERLGSAGFYECLITIDPDSLRLKPSDSQRMIRSYEVLLQTGKPISYFQTPSKSILSNYDLSVIMLKPERAFLHKCCNERFIELVENGGLEEAKALLLSGLIRGPHDSTESCESRPSGASYMTITAQKALGLTELWNYIHGKITLEESIALAQARTRQYAKRQLTWFNNQIKDKQVIEYASKAEFESFLRA
jgi:tRNA dimethylallyltransferase